MSAPHGKIRRLIHIRPQFLCGLAGGLIIGLACWGFFALLGNILLRPIARRQIQQLTGAKVEIDSIGFKSTGFVRMNYLVIGSPQIENYENRILRANKADVRFSLASIFRLKPRIKRITLRDYIINAQYNTDTMRWNLALLNIKKPSEQRHGLPNIEVKRGVVKLSKVANGKAEDIAVIEVDGELKQVRGTDDTYSFYFEAQDNDGDKYNFIRGTWQSGTRGKVWLNGCIPPTDLDILGNRWAINDLKLDLSYDQNNISIHRLKWAIGDKTEVAVSGIIRNYPLGGDYDLGMHFKNLLLASKPTIDALVYNRSALDKLSPSLRKFLEQYNPRGWGDIDIRSKGRFSELIKSKWAGTIRCRDISVLDKKFPYRLEHMVGTLELTEKSVVLNDLQCKHGDVNLNINGQAKKFQQQWYYDVQITSSNMLLDDDLYKALNTEQKRLWFAFAPSGLAQVDYRFTRQPGQEKKTMLTADLLDAQAIYQHFPYPLKNLKGRVYAQPGIFELDDVVSQYEGRCITLNGRITETETERPRYNITIDANDIPIDSTLKAALPAKQREFYENFEVDALTDVRITVFPNEVGRRLVEYIAEASIKNASLIYEKFPLPLTNVNAKAILTPDLVRLESMTGRSGDGKVKVSGRIWPANEANPTPGFCLSVEAETLELDDKWLGALPEGASEIVAQLQPRGKLNISANLNVNVDARGADCPPYDVAIECLGMQINFVKFPYPIENVMGNITVTPNNVELQNLTATTTPETVAETQEPVKIALDGNIVFEGGQVDSGRFSLYAHDILLDDRLAEALPGGAADAYRSISPTGRIDLNINKADFSTDSTGQKWLDLTGRLAFKKCDFGSQKTFSQLNAELTANVLYKLNHGLWAGQADLKADSLKIKDRLVNDLRAAVIYDPEKGTFASREFTADCYGGRMIGDVEIKQPGGDGSKYVLQLAFDNVEVKEILSAKAAQADSSTQGRASGVFSAAGTLGRDASSIGRLNVSVSNMALARRSLLGKVLTTMQLDNPTDFIFSDMTVVAYLKESEIVFEEVYMSGHSMVLQGSGRLDLENDNVDLDFTSFGKKMTSEPSFLESLAKGLGSAVVKVEVHGNVEEPDIQTTTLPVIKVPLEIFGTKP
jgi:hypothetical protein